jgi:DNA polymerase-1
MKIIKNTEISKIDLDSEQTEWVYCALDCALTHEIWGKIFPEFDGLTKKTYLFELDSLQPAMDMMLRGLRVDEEEVKTRKKILRERRLKLERMLNLFSQSVWEKDLNHNSSVQLKKILYEYLGLPPVISYKGGKHKVTADRAALEQLGEFYPRAKPFCHTILALRDITKQLSVLDSKRDEDGRIRCSYNVAGTETGRWSSSGSPWRTGTNLQNVTKELRSIFIPDEGKIMFYADLEQAESRVTAYIAGDENYINACESTDLHTEVVKMVWPNLGWSDDLAQNRELANKPYYLHFTYRDMCKRAGHGTNYGMSPHALAKHLKIKLSHATRFQLLYFGGVVPLASLERWHKQDREGGFQELIDTGEIVGKLVKIKGAFPGIRTWHTGVSNELKQTGCLITPMGRRRQFWSRLNDNSTLREAIAYVPQSTIGDLLNLGLLKVWQNLRYAGLDILAQVHDAILGQCYINKLDTLMPQVLKQMNNPLEIKGRKMIIPSSVEVGYTWKDMKPWMK